MIVPVFTSMRDPDMAYACSEIFRGGYTSTLSEEARNLYGAHAVFPPAPAELICVQATYLKAKTSEPVTAFEPLISDEAFPTKVEASSLYEASVGVSQAAPTFAHPEAMQRWYVEQTIGDNKKLLASYIIARVAENDLLTGALIFPKVVEHESRFWLREHMFQQLTDTGAQKTDALASLLRGEDTSKLGDIAASSFLPIPQVFRKNLSPFTGRASQARRQPSKQKKRKK